MQEAYMGLRDFWTHYFLVPTDPLVGEVLFAVASYAAVGRWDLRTNVYQARSVGQHKAGSVLARVLQCVLQVASGRPQALLVPDSEETPALVWEGLAWHLCKDWAVRAFGMRRTGV